MNVCIFGSASSLINRQYLDAGYELGRILAKHGCRLIFGGGNEGMMGAAARGFQAEGAHITGIIPSFFKGTEFEQLFEDCDETIYTEDIAERLKLMEQRSDAFVVLPGGAGTYEEFFKVLVSNSLRRYHKPLALVNIAGYFDPLVTLLHHGRELNFISAQSLGHVRVFDINDAEKLIAFLKVH